MPTRVWVVRGSRDRPNKFDQTGKFLNRGYIAIGWNLDDVNMSSAANLPEIKRIFLSQNAHGDGSVGNIAGQIRLFLFEMQDGDYVIMPLPHTGPLRFGKVTGDAYHAGCGQMRNRRNVDWYDEILQRSELPSFKNLRSFRRTITHVKRDHQSNEFFERIRRVDLDKG